MYRDTHTHNEFEFDKLDMIVVNWQTKVIHDMALYEKRGACKLGITFNFVVSFLYVYLMGSIRVKGDD